jgi:hypothetical protein
LKNKINSSALGSQTLKSYNSNTGSTRVFYKEKWIYPKFSPNFDLYKGFFMEKNGPNSPNFDLFFPIAKFS